MTRIAGSCTAVKDKAYTASGSERLASVSSAVVLLAYFAAGNVASGFSTIECTHSALATIVVGILDPLPIDSVKDVIRLAGGIASLCRRNSGGLGEGGGHLVQL